MANQKYTDILEKVQEDIRSGRYTPGSKIAQRNRIGQAVWRLENDSFQGDA